MQVKRLATGGRIDREQVLRFRFNGRRYEGHAGDTLASALLANGVKLVGRSFKLHRPRGIVGSGSEEPNALVQLGRGAATLPNQRATEVDLYDGLSARSLRGWPSLRFDIGAVNDLLARFLPAGFYYKTFMSPRRLWSFYENVIRHAAGWGDAPRDPDPDHYEHYNAHCDVLVVGAGPAGLMAALAAAESGARVIIADEQGEPGGRLLSSRERIDGEDAEAWLQKTVAALRRHERVSMLAQSTVFGYFDQNFLAIAQRCGESGPVRERLWRVRARQVVLAQGAFERPLVFCNNDRPGVMLASAVSTYINRYAVQPGSEAVVFTNNDSAYQAALDMHRAGIRVAAIVDSRDSGAGELRRAAEAVNIPVMNGHVVTDVVGKHAVSGVRIARFVTNDDSANSTIAEAPIEIHCDLLAMSGGWSPALHLHAQCGGGKEWHDELHCFVPLDDRPNVQSAGACSGTWSLQACLEEGLRAGLGASGQCGLEAADISAPSAAEFGSKPLQPLWRVPASQSPDACPKQFIDLQNDTSVADLRLAAREGYRDIEHVKRYTALGFGTDQGKLGNINGMAVLAEYLGESIPAVGTTTFRPPYTPVSFGLCAGEAVGELFDPVRKTAMHEWHAAAGAKFENVGQWWRPWYFPLGDEDLHAAVARECRATRASIGIMDASTLGKIDVQGPDAVTFLERIYTHDIAGMETGRCSYAIMLGEDGMVKDDGVVSRLGEQHFYLTTTTGGAAAVMSWLELWLQTEWPNLEVYLTSVTDHYSTISVAGPNSRKLLEELECSVSLSAADFPFMTTQEATLAGFAVRLFRVSFSGELAFEINISSNRALELWQLLMAKGEAYGITPYGTETMHVLRAEKGFVIVGQDTDGSVTPVDLNFGWLLSKNKDYLGKRSLQRPDAVRAGRKQWVGLEPADGETVVREGSQLIADTAASVPVPLHGHVSSSYYSACLERPIALGLLVSGRDRLGDTVYAVQSDDSRVALKVVAPVFYDARGERQRG